jgi:hypothetical protein
MDGTKKRKNRESLSPDNLKLFKLIIDPKEQSKIHKTFINRETQSKRTIINTRTKTFYRFRNLDNNGLIYSLIRHLNHFKVDFYIIDYINKQNINIKCLNNFDATANDAQSELMPIDNDNDNDNDNDDEEDERRYAMITNNIYGHLNGKKLLIGNNVDFLNYVYLNKTGSCFYLIRNPAFFSFMKEIDHNVKISNDDIDIGIFISQYT